MAQNRAMSCWVWRNWTISPARKARTRAADGRGAKFCTGQRYSDYVLRSARDSFRRMSSGVRSDPADWSDPRHRLGVAGEEQAIRYLQSRGWEVVSHRFRVGRIELDLVARRGHLVAFFEVKARRGTAFGSPFEAITGAKRREIVK